MRPPCSALVRAGLAWLATACIAPTAGASAAPAPSHIEVMVDVPPSNFVYRQGSAIGYGDQAPSGGGTALPYVQSPGVSPGAALGINLLANVLVAAAEKAALASALEAARPVGASVQDLDLRATTFEQLRGLLPPDGPRWHFSTEAFPQPAPVPTGEFRDPSTGRFKRAMPPAQNQHLIDRARASAHEAALFIRVLPLYKGLQDRMYVNVAALLIDKSGTERGEWVTQVMAPPAPALEDAELVRWWADERYRRFMVQGLRGALVPLVEELADPALRAQRQKAHAALSGVSFDEAGRPTDRMLAHAINTQRKASTACLLRAEPGEVIYHFERTRFKQQIVGAAYCADEKPTDWNTDAVPGMAWTHQARTAPALVVRRP
jgi:hypothetical protein